MTDEEQSPQHEPVIPPHLQADINHDEYNSDEMEPPDWITDLDREILAVLGNTMMIMTPSVIAKNINSSRSSVSRRLNTLEAGDLVKKVERGHYQISDEGLARMHQKFPVEPPDEGDSDKEWYAMRILTPEQLEELEERGIVDLGP